MIRKLPMLLVSVLALSPARASADDAALAAKDKEIAALKAEVERLKAEVKRLEAALATKDATGGLPAPAGDDSLQGQETSREQLKYLHYLAKAYKPAAGAPQWPALDGKNFVLWLVAVGQLEKGNEGTLKMLFSPADRTLKFPGTKPYAALTSEALATQRFPNLTSYAGRRNAAKDLAITPQSSPAGTALFADLSFHDGALVAFLDGKVKYMSRKDLGLAPTDPLVAGPASKSPVLQTLSTE
jgi:uncharacterized small protein (DUF1192 family)